MLSKVETDKILSIEKDCEALLNKCRLLRLESAPPSPGGASKRKTRRQRLSEQIDKDLEKLFNKKSLT
jgi:hypothetical protein